MWIQKSVSITGLLAALTFVLALVACGGGSSSSSSVSTPPPSNTPRHVQALLSSSTSDGSIGVPGTFISNVLPNISGVSVSLSWGEVESTNSAGTGSGGYDFSAFDSALAPYLSSGKMVNLIVWPATEGGNNEPGNGGSTPAYVFTAAYAAQVGATNPQDMAVCQSYTGDSSNPYYSQAVSGSGGGSWNITTSSDLSGLPVSYELPFMTAYQAFITQVIQHYNGNSSIGYIRFGFSQGGENSPECNQYWGPPGSPNYSDTTYLNYIQTMTNYVKSQSPAMTILEDLHALGQNTDSTYTEYPVAESGYAVAHQFGFGTNGLQQSDTTATSVPCDADWCALFSQYASTEYNDKPITLSLQTLQWSDPTGVAQTGSLTVLLPFAASHDCNNLELYQADVALAFDAANYCSYPHSNCSNGVSAYSSSDSSSYASAIQAFMGSN
jgi:hypothetical protein